MILRGGSFFNFRKFIYIIQLLGSIFKKKKKTTASQTHFGFANMRPEMFWSRAKVILNPI